MSVPNRPPPEIEDELENDETPDIPTMPGELGRIIAPVLGELCQRHLNGTSKDDALHFLRWCQPENLEQYLAYAVEYAAQKTKPKNSRKARERRALAGMRA